MRVPAERCLIALSSHSLPPFCAVPLLLARAKDSHPRLRAFVLRALDAALVAHSSRLAGLLDPVQVPALLLPPHPPVAPAPVQSPALTRSLPRAAQDCVVIGLEDSSSEVRAAARAAFESLRAACPGRTASLSLPPRMTPQPPRPRLGLGTPGSAGSLRVRGKPLASLVGSPAEASSPASFVRESSPPDGGISPSNLYPGDPCGEAAVLPSAGPEGDA